MIKLLKVGATLLVALFVCKSVMAENVNSNKLDKQLELTIVSFDREALLSNRPLHLNVILKNNSKYPVVHIAPKARMPLKISVWDAQGNDLNAFKSDNMKKDRSDAGKEEILAPGETKTFNIYLPILNLPESTITKAELQLEAVYPIVQHLKSEYVVTLIKSSRISVRLNNVVEQKK